MCTQRRKGQTSSRSISNRGQQKKAMPNTVRLPFFDFSIRCRFWIMSKIISPRSIGSIFILSYIHLPTTCAPSRRTEYIHILNEVNFTNFLPLSFVLSFRAFACFPFSFILTVSLGYYYLLPFFSSKCVIRRFKSHLAYGTVQCLLWQSESEREREWEKEEGTRVLQAHIHQLWRNDTDYAHVAA